MKKPEKSVSQTKVAQKLHETGAIFWINKSMNAGKP